MKKQILCKYYSVTVEWLYASQTISEQGIQLFSSPLWLHIFLYLSRMNLWICMHILLLYFSRGVCYILYFVSPDLSMAPFSVTPYIFISFLKCPYSKNKTKQNFRFSSRMSPSQIVANKDRWITFGSEVWSEYYLKNAGSLHL